MKNTQVKQTYGDSIETVFNGFLFLARNRHYSSQYLGSGKTEIKALKDMEETISKHNLRYREELYK